MKEKFDAIVIGSGPGGSAAVRELTEGGLDVLLLEAGKKLEPTDYEPPASGKLKARGMDLLPRAIAMAKGQITQARRPYFSERSGRFLVNDVEDPYTTPISRPYLWIRGKLVGGRMQSYGRVLQRMSDLDFRCASLDGQGADWPIDYAELEPWYDRVEELVGVAGDADGLEHPPDGKYAAPGFLSSLEREFKNKVESRWLDRRVISWRTQLPFADRIPPGLAAAEQTGKLTVRPLSVVTKVVTDARTGLATCVEFKDRGSGEEYRAYADSFLLCCSTIETIRLLLASASRWHPGGLGNSSGTLGRYFMDQTVSVGYYDSPAHLGLWEKDPVLSVDPLGPPGGVLIPRYDNLDGKARGFARGISFQGMGGRMPVPADCPASFGLGSFGEMLPSFSNRVRLSPIKDRWGMPIPHIDLSMGENDRKLLDRSLVHLREMIGECGFRINFIASNAGVDSRWPDFNVIQRQIFKLGSRTSIILGAAIHECGGARMGDDPTRSVVNSRNQLWDAPNVLVCDGAAFVSSGTVGPALTIMALAARAGDFVAGQNGKLTEA
ncbi:MAG: GMC family oxidoreductase [Propionibacteriaceae bacterium]|jgi:choline dehydrogenase-like flavoprotein|nr:GMC family oxidoreductase [Propionibacteriaceae bacterium]